MAICEIKMWEFLNETQKKSLIKTLNKSLQSFEKETGYKISTILSEDRYGSYLHDIVNTEKLNVVSLTEARLHNHYMNQRNMTPAEVFESMTKGFGVLPAKDQNNVLCQFIHDLKEKRSKHLAGTTKDLETAQSNADNAAASLKSLDAIMTGTFDSLYIR